MIDWIDVKNYGHDYVLTIPEKKNNYKNVFDASLENIKYICDNYPPPYTLFVSGGIDSQAMLYLWNKSNVPYTALSVRYNKNLNSHDLDTLHLFSRCHNIQINYLDFDITNFLETEYFQYIENFRCGSPHICSYMKFTDFVKKGTSIFSGNFLGRNTNNFFTQNVFGLYRYAVTTKKSIVPFFLSETKNMAYALEEQYKTKEENYIYNGIPIIKQEKNFTGFEKIKELYDSDTRITMSRKEIVFSRPKNQKSERKFDIIFRNKFELKFEKDKYEVRFKNYVR